MADAVMEQEQKRYEVSAVTSPVIYEVEALTETVIKREAVTDYDGPYTAVPGTEPVTLKTRDRYLTKDITVFQIPYWETSNTSGTTVFIGGKQDGL